MAEVAARKLVMAVLVVCVVGLMPGGAKAQDTSYVSALCATQKIPHGDAFRSVVDSALSDLEQNTAVSGYFYRTLYSSKTDGRTAYAQGICNQKLTQSQCTTCIKDLHGAIWGICGNALGARVQYADCYIRYENFNFP